jgi:hypothetical protein
LISSESCASRAGAAASRQADLSAFATSGEAANDSAECGTATSHNCRARALTFFRKSFESALHRQISAVQSGWNRAAPEGLRGELAQVLASVTVPLTAAP